MHHLVQTSLQDMQNLSHLSQRKYFLVEKYNYDDGDEGAAIKMTKKPMCQIEIGEVLKNSIVWQVSVPSSLKSNQILFIIKSFVIGHNL